MFFFHIKELQALAQKKAELQRKIEEMEKVVREQQANKQNSDTQVIFYFGFTIRLLFNFCAIALYLMHVVKFLLFIQWSQQQVEQETAAVFSAASKDLKFSPTEQQCVLDTEAVVEGFLPECFSMKR